MSTHPLSTNASSNEAVGSAHTRRYPNRSSGAWRELALWVLLAAFPLMLLADAANAAERGTSAHTDSADAGVSTYDIEAACRQAAPIVHVLETTAPDNAQNCRQDEHNAHDQSVKEWSQFDVAGRIPFAMLLQGDKPGTLHGTATSSCALDSSPGLRFTSVMYPSS